MDNDQPREAFPDSGPSAGEFLEPHPIEPSPPVVYATGERPAAVQLRLARPPGPGLPEDLAWTLGMLTVQILCMVAAVALVIVQLALFEGTEEIAAAARDREKIEALIDPRQGAITAVTLLLFTIAAIVATRLRLGRRMFRKLSLRAVGAPHALLVFCAVLPAALVCAQTAWGAQIVWERILEWLPALKDAETPDVTQLVREMLGQVPWPVLLLAIAVAPAVAEELLFRGVIGRGLVARWGVVAGVGITSVLFAAVHLNPVHAVALLPLAFVIHLMYLATRSFYVPMAIHFLNNAIALAVTAMQLDAPHAGVAASEPLPPLLFIAALLCTVAIVRMAWISRVEFQLPDGRRWDPGFPTAEAPPLADARAVARRVSGTEWLATAAAILLFFAALTGFALTAEIGCSLSGAAWRG